MGGKGEGTGEASYDKLNNQIYIIKYSLLFSNVVLWMIGAAIFALCLWLRVEPGLAEWIEKLELGAIYIGVYILVFGSLMVMVVAFLGCLSAFHDSHLILLIYIITQVVGFIVGTVGSALLLEYSTKDSQIQPMIRESIRRLIMNSHHDRSVQTLAVIQEEIGCCGADGASDYLNLRQPLPSQCRDTITGNPYYHGCVDELTWYFEEKASWITALAMVVCMMHVCNAVMTIILIKALEKEKRGTPYTFSR